MDYKNSKIYKLYSPSKNIVYIGSTTQPLCKRLSKHLTDYRAYNKDNKKTYYTSFLVLECEDYKIELLEEYACNNRAQLCKKEGEYILNNECINKNISGRTTKEYYEEYKEKFRALNKKNYEDNKEQINIRHKKYYEDNKDKDEFKKYIKEYSKKYYEDNKEKIAEKRKQYYLLLKK